MPRTRWAGDDDWDDAPVPLDSGSNITQLRYPGDAFPRSKDFADVPDPLPMGLLPAWRRAKEGEPPAPPKTKKKPTKKRPAPAKKAATRGRKR